MVLSSGCLFRLATKQPNISIRYPRTQNITLFTIFVHFAKHNFERIQKNKVQPFPPDDFVFYPNDVSINPSFLFSDDENGENFIFDIVIVERRC